jgi:hypothetical protein
MFDLKLRKRRKKMGKKTKMRLNSTFQTQKNLRKLQQIKIK